MGKKLTIKINERVVLETEDPVKIATAEKNLQRLQEKKREIREKFRKKIKN
jgi:hypothetical protein